MILANVLAASGNALPGVGVDKLATSAVVEQFRFDWFLVQQSPPHSGLGSAVAERVDLFADAHHLSASTDMVAGHLGVAHLEVGNLATDRVTTSRITTAESHTTTLSVRIAEATLALRETSHNGRGSLGGAESSRGQRGL